MKKLFIKDFRNYIQQEVKDLFFIKKISTTSVNNKEYLSITIADKSGELQCKMWSEYIKNEYKTLEPGIYEITADINLYQDNISTIIKFINAVEKYNLPDFAPCYQNIDTMYNELVDCIDQIQKPHIKTLCELFFKNPEMERKIKMCQAGTIIHHVKIGGLVAHILGMLKCALAYIPIYNSINANNKDIKQVEIDIDVVKCACLLHDIGKIKEYVPLPGNERTANGILRGHINMSSEITYAAISNLRNEGIEFPVKDETKLMHCITASHDFCGPNISACKEAILVSRADSMDSMCNAIDTAINNDVSENEFTSFNKYLGTQVYKF